jgi:GTP-binding protein
MKIFHYFHFLELSKGSKAQLFKFIPKSLFCENTNIKLSQKTKILKVELDENNKRKITYEDFDTFVDNKNSTTNKPITNAPSKIKIFGSESNIATINTEEDETPIKEEIVENLITYDQYFSDYCRIYMKAGDGGNGSCSIMKGPLFSDSSPQGGDGGKGGDVTLIADETIGSLSSLRNPHILGNDGKKGSSKGMDGRDGRGITIRVPVGTIVNEIIRDENYKYKKRELRSGNDYKTKHLVDLAENNKEFLICKGGRRGIGNTTKRSINKDSILLKGASGEEKEIELVLKCYADIGLIGYPNAGKSTLLAALTRAVPKIASYPFTTLHPHTGKLKYQDSFSLTLADLPGLIEGAHANKGLGHKFLKHIERTKILVFVLDGSLDPYDKRSPLNDFNSLVNEISLFNKNYSDKEFLIALNKCDLDEDNFEKNFELLSAYDKIANREIVCISGKIGTGLEKLTEKIRVIAERIKLKNK